jgi:hypothetical protein
MRTLALASLLLAVAACRIKGDPSYDAAASTCAAVSHACAGHADCCSSACVAGLCVANVEAGGTCRTSDDCVYTMACDAGRCRPGLVCLPTLGDACTSNNQCCSGNCLGDDAAAYPPTVGTCGSETGPVVELGGPFTVPFYATTTLRAAVTDPDPEDVFYYAWDVLSAPAGALVGWTSSAAAPSVFLSAKGTYVLRVRVADGPPSQRSRLTAQDTVTIVAVNLPPVVSADPTGLPSTVLRHTAIALVGAVSDPNGAAAPVSCAWYVRPPGQAEQAAPIASWGTCPASPATTFTTPLGGPEGVWQFRLEASDGELTSSATRSVNVVNAAPVAIPCAYECLTPPPGGVPFVRAGNLGPPGGATPAVPLHGSATDDNGDVGTPGFSWEWRLVGKPPASTRALDLVLGAGTGTAPPFDGALDPDVAGTYVAALRVDDGWGGTSDFTVAVVVGPWLRPLNAVDGGTGLPRGSVADAAWIHAATAGDDRLVYVGHDGASGLDRLWVLDPASSATAAVPAADLGEAPRCVGLAPDAGSALVGGELSGSPRWERVTLGAAPAAGGANLFGSGWSGVPGDVVDTGGREYAVSSTGVVHELVSSGVGASSQAPLCENCAASAVTGSRAVAATDAIWLLSPAAELRRFTVRPNGNLLLGPTTAVAVPSATDLWLTAAASATQDVAVSTGGIFDAATLAGAGVLPSAARHLDTAAPGGARTGVLVDAAGAAVRTLDASCSETGTLALPRVGWLGTPYTLEPVWAFVRSDGAARYVVLRATVGGAVRWYLATY